MTQEQTKATLDAIIAEVKAIREDSLAFQARAEEAEERARVAHAVRADAQLILHKESVESNNRIAIATLAAAIMAQSKCGPEHAVRVAKHALFQEPVTP